MLNLTGNYGRVINISAVPVKSRYLTRGRRTVFLDCEKGVTEIYKSRG